MSKLITIEDLLGKAKEYKEKEKDKCVLNIKGYEKEIEVEKITGKEWRDILNSKEEDKDAELIYSACPVLRDGNLIESLDCKNNPITVVRKVFNKPTAYHLAEYILKFSGLVNGNSEDYIEEVLSDIKN